MATECISDTRATACSLGDLVYFCKSCLERLSRRPKAGMALYVFQRAFTEERIQPLPNKLTLKRLCWALPAILSTRIMQVCV